MNLLARLRIAPRAGLAFGLLMLTAAGVVFFGTSRLLHLTAAMTLIGLIGEDRLHIVKKLVCILEASQMIASELRNTLIFDDRSVVGPCH